MAHDLIVIGGGPAGYVAAIRAAQLGKKVVCVEKERAGGTCLNWGCIPTKALLRNAELYHLLNHRAAEFGFSFDNLQFDWSNIIGRSRKVSDRLAGGVEMLFRKNKVDYVKGTASLKGRGKVAVAGAEDKLETLEAPKILVATGVVSRELPALPFDGKRVIGSRDALVLDQRPESILIIGAGAIGVEFAYFFNAFGTKVTLIEMMPNILPVEDAEVSETLEKSLSRKGIEILTETKVAAATTGESGVTVTLEGKKPGERTAAVALVAVGVSPLLPGGIDLKKDARGYIEVDGKYQTSAAGVYAAGDIIGPPWLAHVASWEAVQAVDGMFTDHQPKRTSLYPGCTYCQPQVASIGLTERAAKEKGIAYKTGKFPFLASGKALATGESEGFVKILIGEKHGEILGAHIIGSEATEMIAELGLAMTLEATYEEIEATIHAHPTLSEAVHEATAAALGHAINF